MDEIAIRPARPDEQAWVDDRYNEVGFLPSDLTEETVLVAEADDRRVGLGRLVPVGEGAWELGGIWTDPDHRGRGVASRVVEALLEEADATALYCIPFAGLQGFYERYGFIPYEGDVEDLPPRMREKWTYCVEEYDDVVLMVKG